jgi:glycosyltransferase involved in cell wall biosynthesis
LRPPAIDEQGPISAPELVVPISHDWTTLGTGGGIEAFLKLFFQHASKWNLNVTAPCSGPHEATIGSVRFLPIMAHADSELAFTRQLRRALVRGILRMPRRGVVLANEEHYAWAFRGTSLPVVLMSHGAIPKMLRMRHNALFVSGYRFFIERPAVHRACRVVVVNSQLRQYYLSQYGSMSPEKVVEIPIGVDLDELNGRPLKNPLERLSLPRSANLVLFVGRLYPEKNLPLFIAACDTLKQRGQSFEAIVVGDGIQAGLLRQALETRRWLHWVPVMAHSDVIDAMAISRVLAVCSRYEAGPLVLLESIGLGTPVVSTAVGRARELIKGQLGRVVNSDPASIAEGIQDVLEWKPEAVKQASANARRYIDFRDTMNSLVELLRRVGSQ